MALDTPNADDMDGQFATLAEANEGTRALQAPEHAKLLVIARYHARQRLRGTVVEPEDLLHEAITKTLEGTRRWNRRVSMVKHLDRAMESAAGHEIEKRAIRREDALDGSEPELAVPPTCETQMVLAEEAEEALEWFSGDDVALAVLKLKGDGFVASAIREELGMRKEEYPGSPYAMRSCLARALRPFFADCGSPSSGVRVPGVP